MKNQKEVDYQPRRLKKWMENKGKKYIIVLTPAIQTYKWAGCRGIGREMSLICMEIMKNCKLSSKWRILIPKKKTTMKNRIVRYCLRIRMKSKMRKIMTPMMRQVIPLVSRTVLTHRRRNKKSRQIIKFSRHIHRAKIKIYLTVIKMRKIKDNKQIC